MDTSDTFFYPILDRKLAQDCPTHQIEYIGWEEEGGNTVMEITCHVSHHSLRTYKYKGVEAIPLHVCSIREKWARGCTHKHTSPDKHREDVGPYKLYLQRSEASPFKLHVADKAPVGRDSNEDQAVLLQVQISNFFP